MTEVLGKKNSTNRALLAWVDEMAKLCQPEKIFWCDGSEKENEKLCETMVRSGTFTRLNESNVPARFLARSHPSDVARVEDRTLFVLKPGRTPGQPTIGPTPSK